jgi:hypothetical protein
MFELIHLQIHRWTDMLSPPIHASGQESSHPVAGPTARVLHEIPCVRVVLVLYCLYFHLAKGWSLYVSFEACHDKPLRCFATFGMLDHLLAGQLQ